MSLVNYTARMRSMLLGAAAFAALACGFAAQPAEAAKIGPYFPLPNNLHVSGAGKDGLLAIEQTWLENGLENLKKARAAAEADLEKAKSGGKAEEVAAAEEKIKTLDADIASTTREIAVTKDKDGAQNVQVERKRLLMLAVNQWINELNRQATQQMKIAIMKDGMEAQVAQNQNFQLSTMADELEKVKHDTSMERWGN